jgi:hypothetical protein
MHMHSATKGAAVVLGLIALLSFGYAAYMFSRGDGEDALPLIISGVICGAMIVVLSAAGKKPKE